MQDVLFCHRDGTTDVTRTFHYGTPTAEEIVSLETRLLINFLSLLKGLYSVVYVYISDM